MALADLTTDARRRAVRTWLDPEVTQEDFRARFHLGPLDCAALAAEHGPKARLGSVSRWAINAYKKTLKQRRLAAEAVGR